MSTSITKVGFSANLERVFLGGARKEGMGGFYVTGQNGAQLISIYTKSNSPAYHNLIKLFKTYLKY